MNKIVLRPHQKLFAKAEEQYVGLFGGIGNGKTFIACLKIIEHLTQNSNNLCLIGRLTYPELRDSTRETFLQALALLYPPEAYKFNKAENSITFWNKSVGIFRHLDETKSLLGPNLGAFYIDQAEEIDEDVFLTLQGRLRRQGVTRRQGYITGNPRGHNWVYYKFGMDQARGEINWNFNKDYRMLTAPTIANAANLPINYIEQLQRSYSKEWFERYVMGSWDVFEGQIFDLSKITGFDVLPKIKLVFTACDPAISKEKNACNTAFCTIGVGENGHLYDLETIAGKWSFYETLAEARSIRKRLKFDYLGVENTAYQQSLVEACRKEFPDLESRMISLDADRDKFRRAKSVSHIVQRGFFHTNNRELLSEMSAFDPDADGKERKDRVDALVHALHMVQQYAPTRFEIHTNPYEGLTPEQMSHKYSQDWFKQAFEEEKKKHSSDNGFEKFSTSDISIDPDFY